MGVGGIARATVNSLPGINVGPGEGELPSASLAENAQFNALVVVPNAVQGLFRRRARAVRAATRADVDRWAVRLLRGMRRTYGGSPVWVRVGPSQALLLLDVADVRRLLEGSPDPYASDPEAKRKGMGHFQPDALTISRDGEWRSRRPFNEAVLGTGEKPHPVAERATVVVADEVETALAAAAGAVDWQTWAAAFQRIARRIVLGDSAREDDELTAQLARMMDEANSLPDGPSEELGPYLERLERYAEAAEEGGLVSRFASAPADERTASVRQVTHWLFAMGDTLAINTLRTLAAIASHPDALARAGEPDHLAACLHEAMRLWPTTPMLAREAVRETDWRGAWVPKGTQLVIVNTYMHRDPDRHEFANRFAPEAWTEGDASEDWAFNHLSHGPQACPGADLVELVGCSALATVLEGEVAAVHPRLDPARPMPHMLDFFEIRVRLGA